MKPKYYYTQDAERPNVKYLDMYYDGETRTIASYDTETDYKDMLLSENVQVKAVWAFFSYCANGRPIKPAFGFRKCKLWHV